MSSHHIIREDQEPALLILDVHAVPFELVQELLEWSPTVMVLDQHIDEVLGWGIKMDVVIAEETKIASLTTLLQDQFPLKLISYKTTDEALSTALYFLIAEKQKGVNVIAEVPLENFESFSSLDISVFQSGKRWSFIRSGLFEKWLPAGRTLQVYPSNGTDLKTSVDGVVTIRQENCFWVGED